MTQAPWGYFIIGIVAYQILRLLAMAINRAIVERRQKRFLKLVDVMIPGKGKITLISIDTSDKRTLARLERELREKYDLIEDQPGEPYG